MITELIEKYNLVIRKLPDVQISRYYIDENKVSDYKLKDNEWIEHWKPTIENFETEKAFENFYKRFPNGRYIVVEEIKKEILNKFLVTFSNNFLSTITFSLRSKEVFIGDTLEEAVMKCVNYLERTKIENADIYGNNKRITKHNR